MTGRLAPLVLLALAGVPAPASPAGLAAPEQRVAQAVDRQLPETLALLQKTVEIPSATENLAGVRAVGEVYARELRALGFTVRWAEMPPEMHRAGHLVAERTGTRGKRILLIGHLDTVLEGQPFRREGDRAFGNGTDDMKGGNATVIAALRALHATGALEDRRIILIFTGDEEDPGTPLSVARKDLVEAGRRSDAALAFEGAVGNTATIARRGISTWQLSVTAQTAHSSGIFRPEVGAGAVFEMARILDRWREQLSGEKDLTFNPSLVAGGTTAQRDEETHRAQAEGKANVIAGQAEAAGDLRFLSREQYERARERMTAIARASLPHARAELTFRDGYPPMAPTEGNLALLAVLDQASRDLGFGPVPALDPGLRGAGDVSFVAADLSALDGLGAAGDGAHTPQEYMDLADLPRLVKRTALLVYRLTR